MCEPRLGLKLTMCAILAQHKFGVRTEASNSFPDMVKA